MKGVAKSKYIRMSARKIKLVLDKIKGKKVSDAYNILMFTDKRAVGPVKKTLASAVANAGAADMIEKIKVESVWVGQGPSLKRLRPRAMGRADVFKKPSAHIKIEVG